MTEENWTRQNADLHEQVVVKEHGPYTERQEVVVDQASERRQAIGKATGLIWLLFGILEALIALRVFLKLIAANPANPFANLVYGVTDLFLWPFFGLVNTPAAGNFVLDIPAIIAMIVYAIIAWVLVRLVWLLFDRYPTRTVTTYERDDLP